MKTLFQTLCDLDASGDEAFNEVINIFAFEHGLDADQNRDDIIDLIADTTNQVTAVNAYNIVATGSRGVPQQISGKDFDINTTMPLGKRFMN